MDYKASAKHLRKLASKEREILKLKLELSRLKDSNLTKGLSIASREEELEAKREKISDLEGKLRNKILRLQGPVLEEYNSLINQSIQGAKSIQTPRNLLEVLTTLLIISPYQVLEVDYSELPQKVENFLLTAFAVDSEYLEQKLSTDSITETFDRCYRAACLTHGVEY